MADSYAPLPHSFFADAAPPETVILEGPGLKISNRQIQLGSSIFVPSHVSGISVSKVRQNKFWYGLGFFFFTAMTLSSLWSMIGTGEIGSGIIITFIVFVPLTIWFALRLRKPPKLCLEISTAGGFPSSFHFANEKELERIVAAIKQVILK